jgi:hypothetical protein
MAGDTAWAGSLAQDLAKRYPLDSQMEALWLPPIRVQVARNKKNSPSALAALQPVSPIEFGQINFIASARTANIFSLQAGLIFTQRKSFRGM